METITVFEHGSLKVGDKNFTKKDRQLLERFRGDYEEEKFPYYTLIHNGVKFKQYVGVLSVGNLQIEVLPKADKSDNVDETVWRNNLIKMLSTVYKLEVKMLPTANQNLKTSQILDIFIQRFLDEVEMLLQKGLVKTYRKTENNKNALKGCIVWAKHLSQNLIHKERFFVNYTTYDSNHVCNRIIYKALQIISSVTTNPNILCRQRTILFDFPELQNINVSASLFHNLCYDRRTEDYKTAIGLAKLLLINYLPCSDKNHTDNILAFMFDMNRLWEEYVYIILRRQLTDYEVTAQDRSDFWKKENISKTIRPDIVCIAKDAANKNFVLDTKWKLPDDNCPSDADLKQMYVYHHYWNVDKTALVYPCPTTENKTTVSGNYQGVNDNTKQCSICGNYQGDNDENKQCSMIFLQIGTDENLENHWGKKILKELEIKNS